MTSLRDRIVWNCRFHPTDFWHEHGCPHREWERDEIQRALVMTSCLTEAGMDMPDDLLDQHCAKVDYLTKQLSSLDT